MMRILGGLLVATTLATTAWAEEPRRLIFGIGYDDLRDYREPSAQVSAEIEWGRVSRLPALRWRASAMAMLDGDLWLGAGVSYRASFADGPWFFEASFGPGLYYRKDEDPGVGNVHFPMFRSQGGFGYALENGGTVALLLTHLSDGGLDVDAGSSESIVFTYSRPF